MDAYHRCQELRDSTCHDTKEELAGRFDLAVWLQNQPLSQNNAIFKNAMKCVGSNRCGDLADYAESLRRALRHITQTIRSDFDEATKNSVGEKKAKSLKKPVHLVTHMVIFIHIKSF